LRQRPRHLIRQQVEEAVQLAQAVADHLCPIRSRDGQRPGCARRLASPRKELSAPVERRQPHAKEASVRSARQCQRGNRCVNIGLPS
jgi:hypothetical protein